MKELKKLLKELDTVMNITYKNEFLLLLIDRISKIDSIDEVKDIIKTNIRDTYNEYELSYNLINLHFSDYISDFIKKETSNDRIEVSFNYEINNDTLSMFITLENYLGDTETLIYKTELKGKKYLFNDPYFVANSLMFLRDSFFDIRYTFLDDFLNLDI